MSSDLPRLLIVSEVSLSQQGMGANRTLFNLFDSYPSDKLMLLAPETSLKAEPTAPPFDQRVFSFSGYYLPPLKNRLGLLINFLINSVNLQLLDWLPIANKKSIEYFAPEVILVCPLTPWCLLMGHKLANHFHCPSLIYLMDDWLAKANSCWLSGNTQTVAYKLLQESAGWLMISEQLEADLSNRYQLRPKRSLIVHNPVDLSGKKLPDKLPKREGIFRVAYAGSILPIHYDALAVVAEAIFQLRCDGKDIELVLYTHQSFWDFHQEQWEQWQVVYGSFILYTELDCYLKQADLLLVASSFRPEYTHAIRSSVFTKLTDYMAVGRPILSCGPDYSACNQFINKWKCGYVIESNRVIDIKLFLERKIRRNEPDIQITKIAFDVLNENFGKAVIGAKVTDFICQAYLTKIKNIITQ